MAAKKFATMCDTVSMGAGDFRENVRLTCNKMLDKCESNNWTFHSMEITRISGSIENTMLLITIVYSK